MKIKSFVFNPLAENTYLIYDETTGDALLVDPGNCREDEDLRLARFVRDHSLTIHRIICTHLHFDHVFGLGFASTEFGCGLWASKGDLFWLEKDFDYASVFGFDMTAHADAYRLSGSLMDGDIVEAGSLRVEVIAVPGHSKGGLAFYLPEEKILFSGDSLFAGSIGRTDFEGGDLETLLGALRQRILTLPEDVTVYPGHGPATTIGDEKCENPYL